MKFTPSFSHAVCSAFAKIGLRKRKDGPFCRMACPPDGWKKENGVPFFMFLESHLHFSRI
jgi:hypothetical protein